MSGVSNPIESRAADFGGTETLAQTLILGDVTGASSGIFFSDGDGANFASSSEIAFSSTINPLGPKDLFINRQGVNILGIGSTSGSIDGTIHVATLKAFILDTVIPEILSIAPTTATAIILGATTILNDALGVAGLITASGNMQVPDSQKIILGTSGVFKQGGLTALTDGVATTVFSVESANGDMPGISIDYTIQSADGSAAQVEKGIVQFAFVDLPGGITSATPGVTAVQALSSGTLTVTWSVVTTDDGDIEIQVNADTSLTPITHQIRWGATISNDVEII